MVTDNANLRSLSSLYMRAMSSSMRSSITNDNSPFIVFVNTAVLPRPPADQSLLVSFNEVGIQRDLAFFKDVVCVNMSNTLVTTLLLMDN